MKLNRIVALLLALVLALGLLAVAGPKAKADGPDCPQITSFSVSNNHLFDNQHTLLQH